MDAATILRELLDDLEPLTRTPADEGMSCPHGGKTGGCPGCVLAEAIADSIEEAREKLERLRISAGPHSSLWRDL